MTGPWRRWWAGSRTTPIPGTASTVRWPIVDADGIVAAAFRQHTSRALDPQLHTHVVVANRVASPDGRWLALDARTVKYDQRTLSALYHATLRAGLTARLGVRWADPVNGIAEIADVPEGGPGGVLGPHGRDPGPPRPQARPVHHHHGPPADAAGTLGGSNEKPSSTPAPPRLTRPPPPGCMTAGSISSNGPASNPRPWWPGPWVGNAPGNRPGNSTAKLSGASSRRPLTPWGAASRCSVLPS